MVQPKTLIPADSEAKKLFYQKYSNDICSIFLQVRMIGFVTWPSLGTKGGQVTKPIIRTCENMLYCMLI